MTISSIGLGTYIGDPNTNTDKLVTQATIDCVKSGKINFIDTAINYRYQKAERSIGKAIKELLNDGITRDQIFIASKNGYIAPDGDLRTDGLEITKELI